jgi:RNA-directed DNA polymerase
VEQRGLTAYGALVHKGDKGEMIKTPISLQDLRRRLYVKARAEPAWRVWGLDVHVCKMETRREVYRLEKANDGAPGVDGVTCEAIKAAGVEAFLGPLQEELVQQTYRPLRLRKVRIPKEGGTRQLSIPAILDRVVQGAVKLILEPIFEADCQPGSYGYRPKKSAHDAIQRVAEAILAGKTDVLDLDLRASCDTVRHHTLLEQVARRVNDDEVLRLLTWLLHASGKQGVPQGGMLSPLLSHLDLNEVDKMLEQAKAVTRHSWGTAVEYCRFADDLVVLVDAHPRQQGRRRAVERRLREELAKRHVEVNEDKSRRVDLKPGESFGCLGFVFRRIRRRSGRWMPLRTPRPKRRTALLRKLKPIFRRHRFGPLKGFIEEINPIVRGWVPYVAFGHSSRCFSYVRRWVEQQVRRHLATARKRPGFGWKRWSSRWLYDTMGLFDAYRVRDSAIAERGTSPIGPITLEAKCAGARRAGNPHAACDVAGAGKVAMVAR